MDLHCCNVSTHTRELASRRAIHVCGKLAERFVEVVHLCQDANRYDDQEDVSRGVFELVVASQCEFKRNAERFDRHDRYRADCRANRKVYEWVLLAMQRRHSVDHDSREYAHDDAVKQEPCYVSELWRPCEKVSRLTRTECITQHLIHVVNVFVCGRMKDYHDRAYKT